MILDLKFFKAPFVLTEGRTIMEENMIVVIDSSENVVLRAWADGDRLTDLRAIFKLIVGQSEQGETNEN